MHRPRKPLQALGFTFLLSAFVFAANAPSNSSATMPEDKRIVHALNRFTFGARPGDIERIRAIGLDKWFDQQLHPEKINDSAVEARLAPFRTLKMSTREMVENFPPPQVLKAVENGRMSMPHDAAKRAIYESQIARLEQRQEKKQEAAGVEKDQRAADSADAKMDSDAEQGRQKRIEAGVYADIDSMQLLQLPAEERYKKILSMYADERLDLAREYRGPKMLNLVNGMKPEQQETIEAIINPQIVIGGELSEAKLLRAIYSERQLQEVMTDFWYNHFNIYIGKGPDRYMITAYERDVIRPHALGKFKDLLVATAKSPAMLYYLDNWQSVGPHSELAKYGPQRRRFRRGRFGQVRMPPSQQKARNRPSGLNENYAREIMELHTLGVDGGYTQKDVTELAKVLTGWTIDEPRRGGEFKFNERAHEPGTKYVLGHTIKQRGEAEGMEMLDILAHHPSTAKFISRKLATRFVSDDPPQSLVDRMAATFLKKDGDIREVLRTMFKSPEFWSADAYRAKVKTPLEFVASAVRASGVNVDNALPLVQVLNRMSMPPYGMQPPTGYSMKADAWVNSSALLNRMNFGLALGSGRMPGTSLDSQQLLRGNATTSAEGTLSALEQDILDGDVSAQTHAVLLKQLNDPKITQRKLDDPGRPPNVGAITGLIMGSPEFQRR
jgi:uncharacterized protein (DUF1800 family)